MRARRVVHGVRALSATPRLVAAAMIAFAHGQVTAQEAGPSSGTAEFAEFDPGFFTQHGGGGVDVSQYTQGNILLPGSYEAQIHLNGDWVGRQTLRLANVEGAAGAQLCLDRQQLQLLGIDIDAVAAKAASVQQSAEVLPADGACGDIGRYVPGATAHFEDGENRLVLTVPQLYLQRSRHGYVSPDHWQAGINAGFLRYTISTARSRNAGLATRSTYLGLNGGLNLGRWHLRHSGSLSQSSGGRYGYRSNATSLQRSLPSIQSNLAMGQTFTRGDMFTSVRLLGVSVATDDRMLPDFMTVYTPVVRGVAQSNARVSIRQRGMLLQEINVAAGPFLLDELVLPGSGGDLEVTVAEADGREQRFVVPFASSARLLRPGYGRYAVSAGTLDEATLAYRPAVLQATYQYGLGRSVTGYAGAVGFAGYRAGGAGAAFNTPVGALSLDLTASQSAPAGAGLRGYGLQARYNRDFVQSGTGVALNIHRYAGGFLGLLDAAQLRGRPVGDNELRDPRRLRDRFDISLNQQMGRGSIYLTATARNYWNSPSGNLGYSAGYSSYLGRASYSVRLQRSGGIVGDNDDTRVDLTFSVPWGDAPRTPNLSVSLSEGARQRDVLTGIGGVFGVGGKFNYSANAGASSSRGSSLAGRLEHQGAAATVAGSLTRARGYDAATLDISGGLIAHRGGVTFTPELGDTVGLVHVPMAKGTRLNGNTFGRVDRRGYGVVPQLTPFRNNAVELDPSGASHDVGLESASHNVAPYAGAIVLLSFKTKKGLAILITALRDDGSRLPFGAHVIDGNGDTVGYVGQAGRVFLRTEHERGDLLVRWGKAPAQQCRLAYALASSQVMEGRLRHLQGTCRDIAVQPDDENAAEEGAHVPADAR